MQARVTAQRKNLSHESAAGKAARECVTGAGPKAPPRPLEGVGLRRRHSPQPTNKSGSPLVVVVVVQQRNATQFALGAGGIPMPCGGGHVYRRAIVPFVVASF